MYKDEWIKLTFWETVLNLFFGTALMLKITPICILAGVVRLIYDAADYVNEWTDALVRNAMKAGSEKHINRMHKYVERRQKNGRNP